MTNRCILGIDSGLTVTKAVIFSENGSVVSIGHCEIERIKPRPRFVERDMNNHWRRTRNAIREAVEKASIDPSRILAIGVTGHGDGIYLLDQAGAPLGNAILSLDTRAATVAETWRDGEVAENILQITGQVPFAPSPSALLAWIKKNEPERFARIGSVLSCKDWLRYKLTGAIGTDWTEASASFVDVHTQSYSDDALKLFELDNIKAALPEMHDPCEVVGGLTDEAAEATGLQVGTPVVAGLHDVTASAVGAGVVDSGILALIAGTFSINEMLSSQPHPSRHWFCRSGFRRGEWMNISMSPASSANIDWFVKQNCRDAILQATEHNASPFDYLEDELADAFSSVSSIIYHPFLYGSPHGDDATAAFLGVQGWHHRGHLMRALLEGVVFNHRYHVDALKTKFSIHHARLTGGSSRSPRICQLFADALGLDIEVVDVDETGALGAALCAAVGIGLFGSLSEAAKRTVSVAGAYSSREGFKDDLDERYIRYRRSIKALWGQWRSLRGEKGQSQ